MCIRKLAVVVVILINVSATGCVGLSTHLSNSYETIALKFGEKRQLAAIRQETRQQLAEQRQEALKLEMEQAVREAKMEALRQNWEKDFCKANQEALQRNVESQIRESVDSKVSFDVNQGLEIGELEVDVEALKLELEKRDQEALTRNGDQEALRAAQKSCGFHDRECGCAPGLRRRHCHNCKSQKCSDCEKDCGGPEALARLQEPLTRPFKPTEIPLKMNVRLTFGMQNPQVEETRIRREPLRRPDQEALERAEQKSPEIPGQKPSQKEYAPLGPAPIPEADARVSAQPTALPVSYATPHYSNGSNAYFR